MTSADLERLGRTAYEAHRAAIRTPLPPWEDTTEQEQQAWKAAASAVAGQTVATRAEQVPIQSMRVQAGNKERAFKGDFFAGRRGDLVIDDEFASSQHARFYTAHGGWYVEDLGSTNGTWLNGWRISASQPVKKNDKVKIGHTVIIVLST